MFRNNQIFNGRFKTVKKAGAGAFGEIYKGKITITNFITIQQSILRLTKRLLLSSNQSKLNFHSSTMKQNFTKFSRRQEFQRCTISVKRGTGTF